MDRFRQHLEKVSQKVKCRNNLIQKLSGTNWGANGNVLRTAALSLVYSCAEYCAPAWYRSNNVDILDTQLNISMRTITGAVDSTPVPWLHVLSNIPPPEVRRKMAAHKEMRKCLDVSRGYELPIRQELVNDDEASWKTYWNSSPYFSNKHLVDNPAEKLEGFELPRREWRMLNRFRSGHGCCGEQMYRWNFRNSPICDCDNDVNQSLNHVLNYCPLRRFEHGLESLHRGSAEGIELLRNLDIEI